jgi:hypothetical protein
MYDPFYMGLEPQSLHNCMIFGLTLFRISFQWNLEFQHVGSILLVVMEWWLIHTAIHCIWSLSTTLHMSRMDVWSILHGPQASIIAYWDEVLPSCDPGFQQNSQIGVNTYGYKGKMTDSYAHPLHMIVVKHFTCVSYGCLIHSGLVFSLNHCTMAWFVIK